MTGATRHKRPAAVGAMVRLAVLMAALFCSMSIVTPTLDTLLGQTMGQGAKSASGFMLAHSLPQVLLLGLLVGAWSDRAGRRLPLAVVGSIGTGVATILLPHIADYPALLVLRFLDGLFGIAAIGMVMTRALDLAHGGYKAVSLAAIMAAIPAGYLLGSMLSWLTGAWGLGLSALYAIAGVAVCAAALLLLIDSKQPERVEFREPGLSAMMASFRRIPCLWLPILFGTVDKFSFALLAMLPSLVVRQHWGIEGFAATGAIMTAFWVCYLLATVPAGFLMRRWGPLPMVAVGSFGYGASLIVAMLWGSIGGFAVSLALAGAFTAVQFTPNLLLIDQFARPDEKATAMSAFNLSGSYGLMLGFAAVGLLSHYLGYTVTFVLVGTAEIGCSIIAVTMARRNSLAPATASEATVLAPPPPSPQPLVHSGNINF